MASGAPFVASDKGIASSLMRDSGIGYPVHDDSDWPTVLRRAIRDVQGRRAMARASLAFAQDHLAYEKYRTRILAAYLINGPED